ARVTVVEGDALELTWPPADLLAGNLPFSIATAVITRALELRIPRWVVMVQREVGNRICSGPGSRHYGRLSVLAALYGKAELFLPVTSEAFYPTPKVDGVVIRFDARADPMPVSSVPELEAIVRGLFHQRRKQLGNILPRLFRSKAAGLAEAALWPHDWQQLRPEQLSPDAFFRLAQAARTAGAVPTLSSPSKAANPLE
ncbi:MAG TPA: rRNA adenine dimethyltransferase family protein, partial [Thermoplasmata archaeon]|nr:rRNA adenine dimethyltransferase family protein [Thermoplasmata archaeon]